MRLSRGGSGALATRSLIASDISLPSPSKTQPADFASGSPLHQRQHLVFLQKAVETKWRLDAHLADTDERHVGLRTDIERRAHQRLRMQEFALLSRGDEHRQRHRDSARALIASAMLKMTL